MDTLGLGRLGISIDVSPSHLDDVRTLEPLSFLAAVPGCRQNFLRKGFTEADVDQLSDRLVDGLVVWGSVGDIADRVAEHHEAGADHVVLAPLGASSIAAGRALSELVVSSK
ncbi:hypothetical protein [Rhodococcus sp. 14-2483-1-2]|uniref:hypothetical protein n=1 Tax=Rhodococcus sp. 14-2483-1-2 TaxID=2023147 RepID=UPI000B9ACC3D|nr:hypothetical protein [Rhodococcus sp. 14-2483-1-2]OZF30591.1 hypothetical protein CH295_16030 [Rhodococcus sp. 14-2483-1-2]